MARILVPLPDRDFDVTEVAVPWKLLTRAGHEVVFATEAGATPAADPLLLSGVLFGALGAEPEAKAFYAELERAPGFARPRRWADLDPEDFAALFLPGGHAAGMRQYLGSAELQAKVAGFWATGRPVAAICHGPLVLARAVDPATGRSVLHGKKTTCLPKYMERTAFYLTAWRRGRYYRTYPAYVEDEVRGALASADDLVRGPRVLTRRGSDGDDRAAFTVRDGAYLSARWPGDSYKIAKELIAGLAVLVVLLWGALASARTRLNMPAGWTWPPSAAMADRGRACLAHLDALGVSWRAAPPRRKVTTPIYLEDMTVAGVALVPLAKKGPFVMDCLLAAAFADTAAVL